MIFLVEKFKPLYTGGDFVYDNKSSIEYFINLSWDLMVVIILLITFIYLFGNLLISTGIPQYYIEKYVLTLVSSLVGVQSLFTLMFYLGRKDKIGMFGVPIIDLTHLEHTHFLSRIVVYTSSSLFILFLFLLTTIPFLMIFTVTFKNDIELRHNKILIPSYRSTLLIILLSTILTLYCSLPIF